MKNVRSVRWWMLATLLVCGVYLGAYLTRGWFPHDDGALGQTAERVLQGEVPHRDFDEPYTGLLTYVHAAAFKLGGVRLPVLRIPLFVAALLAMAAVFRIALRFVSAPAAGAVTLLALAWTVPNYPASMPSWYNLFFALFGVLALVRWEETRRSRWLVLAGLAGGVSFLIKLSGLFFVAGGLLFLVFATRAEEAPPRTRGGSFRAGAAAITLGLGVFVALLWRSVAPYYWPRVIYHFVAPGALLAGTIAVREWVGPVESGRARLERLLGAVLPFLAGIALPIGLFLGGYALAGAIPELLTGVFVAPFRRLAFANMVPPAPYWALAAAPLAVLLRPRPDWQDARWRRMGVLVALLLAGVLWLAAEESFVHRVVWQSVRNLIPVVAAVAAAFIAVPRLAASWPPGRRRLFLLLASVTTCASLIQFPFSSPTYFLYVVPLLLLTVLALVEGAGRSPRPLLAVTLAFYLGFAVFLVTPGAGVGMAFQYEREHPTAPLRLPRAGLRIRQEDAELYGYLIPRVQARASGGRIWAGPDAPEVYFLGGFQNPTRSVFDFLGPATASAPFLESLERVSAIVINGKPSFSAALPPELVEEVRRRFPNGEAVGRFELRWR